MALFREKTPQRRTNIDIRAKYGAYKDELQEDFNFRCGYCDDLDEYRNAFYEIDHFVPKGHLVTMKENTYANLVYTCRYCNNAKSNTFPTKDENTHNDGVNGFTDPCHADYDKQFERERGKIIAKTPLGEYMWREMKLYLLSHELIYNLTRIDKCIRELRNFDLSANEPANDLLNLLYRQSWEIQEQLREISGGKISIVL